MASPKWLPVQLLIIGSIQNGPTKCDFFMEIHHKLTKMCLLFPKFELRLKFLSPSLRLFNCFDMFKTTGKNVYTSVESFMSNVSA